MRVIVYQASDTSTLSKNFARKDFKCPCGCSRQMVDSELVEKLQAIRDKLGKAIKATSGYRCLSHNAAVGGSSGSKHRYGMAADWRLVDRSINPVALGIIATQYFKAVGIYWYDGCAIVHTDRHPPLAVTGVWWIMKSIIDPKCYGYMVITKMATTTFTQ